MTKIRIPVERVKGNDDFILSAKKALFASVPLFIVASGFFLGWNIYEAQAPLANAHSLLGAVSEGTATVNTGEVTSPTGTTLLAAQTEDPLSDEEIAVNETFSNGALIEHPVEQPAVPERTREDLVRLITESEMAIIRETSEIARIRNVSIALVSEFDTNCGDWEDDCARYYVTLLEQNNTAYNDLILKIEQDERTLEDLRSEMASLE